MDLQSIDSILRFAGLLEPTSTSTSGDGRGSNTSGSGSLLPDPPFWPAGGDSDKDDHSQRGRAIETLRSRVRAALELIGSVLALFPLESLALTFNGGKDACVVFYLVRAAVALAVRQHQRQRLAEQQEEETEAEAEAVAAALRRVAVLYFIPRHGEFAEVQAFMAEVAAGAACVGEGACGGVDAEGGKGDGVRPSSGWRGDLGGFAYTEYEVGYREGMADMVEGKGLKAVFMGVRSGDPYSLESEHVQPSSPGWPPFLRVNPILKWDYGHVWNFLRGFGLPYCCLYDQGYTSIGDVRTTVRNPALLDPPTLQRLQAAAQQPGGGTDVAAAVDDLLVGRLPDDPSLYRPAYELGDYTLERANRAPSGSKAAAGATKQAPSPPPPSAAAAAAAAPAPSQHSPAAIDSESLDASTTSTSSQASAATAAATAAASSNSSSLLHAARGGQRKRGSFCERLPVALICVGDFLAQHDTAPLALAHELQELRCRVSPLLVLPPGSPAALAAHLDQTLRLLYDDDDDDAMGRDCSSLAPPRVVFVHGMDADAWAAANEAIAQRYAASNAASRDGASPNLFLHPGRAECAGKGPDDGPMAVLKEAAEHVTAYGDRVFLLGRAFERGGGGHGSQGGPLSLGQQKAELDGLLDAISFSIAISEAQPSLSLSSLPPDPVVAARK